MKWQSCSAAAATLFCALCSGVTALSEEAASRDKAPIKTARELFDLFGIDEGLFQSFSHGQSFSAAEQEPLARLLVRLPQVRLVDVEQWSNRRVDWTDVASQPSIYQREFVRIAGRVYRVTRETLPAYQERFDLDGFYRCEVQVANGNQPAIVFARAVPSRWKLDEPLDERASADAVFLKLGPEAASGKSEMYFAADRMAWHPDSLLGDLGMDYGLFDTVQQRRPITNEDRECFFQLLAAAGRADAAQLAAGEVQPSSNLVRLLKSPDEHLGELFTFRGVARRAVKILVTDADIGARLGFDHYFELAVFLDLKGVAEVAGRKVSSHPVVFCVRELPAGMPTGENIAEVVQASGFMFKNWRYTTQLTQDSATNVGIISPLLIGKTVRWEQRALDSPSLVGSTVGGILVTLIAAVAGFAWWFARRDRRASTAMLAKRYTITDGSSLDEFDLDASLQREEEVRRSSD